MSIINNKAHFLHQHLKTIEVLPILGKEDGFSNYLTQRGINNTSKHWEKDHSSIDWENKHDTYQFFFDYEGNEKEITEWLANSKLKNHSHIITWLSWEDPIIKIPVVDFINYWEEIYLASVEGFVAITEDSSLIIEFTDDFKYHLNSNFQIKPNSKNSW